MKNPITYLKHIVKDPVTTMAEADAREKEIIPLFYASAGMLLLGVILQIAAKLDFMATFSFIGLVGTAFCLFLFSILESARQRFESLTCDHCNTLPKIDSPETFGAYLSFIVEQDEATFKEGQHPTVSPTNGVHSYVKISASSSAILSVALTCPHCGEVKRLRYSATPFKCHTEQKNVRTIDYELVHQQMEAAVRSAVNDYNNPDKKRHIPYSIHSSKNAHFSERTTFKGANASGAHPDYLGVKIDYHKDVEEMLLHYFTLNELNGSLIDPSKPRKKSFPLLKILKRVIKFPPIGKGLKNAGSAAEAPENPAIPDDASCQDTCFAIEQNMPVQEPLIADSESSLEAAPVVLQESNEPQSAPADCSAGEHPQDNAVALEHDSTQEDIPALESSAPSNDAIPEAIPVVAPKKKADTKQPAEHKRNKKAVVAIVAVCAAVITAGAIYGILRAGNGAANTGDTPAVGTPGKLYISDYVGYWRIGENQQKELIVHNGDQNSVRFSLAYGKDASLNDIVAQLDGNIGSFSMAIDGGVIKGRLTFQPEAIGVEITQSTLAMAPVERMEYTEQRMTSWLQSEDQNDPEIDSTEPTEGTQPTVATEPPTVATEPPVTEPEETEPPVTEPEDEDEEFEEDIAPHADGCPFADGANASLLKPEEVEPSLCDVEDDYVMHRFWAQGSEGYCELRVTYTFDMRITNESESYYANNDGETLIKTIDTYFYEDGAVESWLWRDYHSSGHIKTQILKEYDPEGNLIVEHQREGDAAGNQLLRVTIDADGSKCVQETTSDGKTVRITDYYSNGQIYMLSEYDENGNAASYIRYNEDGSVSDSGAHEYDSKGNHTKWIEYNSDGSIDMYRTYTYDKKNNLVKTSFYDAEGNLTHVAEDDTEGRTVKDIYYNSDGSIRSWIAYEYNSAGKYSKKTEYKGKKTLYRIFEYDYETRTKTETCYNEDGSIDYVSEWEILEEEM